MQVVKVSKEIKSLKNDPKRGVGKDLTLVQDSKQGLIF